jgi:hypothetical protein
VRRDHLDGAILECLSAVQRLLECFPERGVVIGGVAVGVLAQPRATQDVDAVLLMDPEEVPHLIEIAGRFGLVPRVSDPVEFARRSRMVLLRHGPTGVPLDLSLGVLPFEVEMVERKLSYEAEGLTIPLPTPEDLVIMKATAHRPQDLADIDAIIRANVGLDRARIETWVRQFAEALDMPELWDDIATWFDRPAESAP